jgi:hypothetical protein
MLGEAGSTNAGGAGSNRVWELAFVFVLPVVCLVVDLAVGGFASFLAPVGLTVALLIGLSAYAFSKRQHGERMHGFLYGLMAVGFALALIIFLVLSPVSVSLILLFGLGLLGFVPLGTAYWFGQRAKAMFGEREHTWTWTMFAALGMAGGLLVPLGLQLADHGVVSRASKNLDSPDPALRLEGLATLTRYPFCPVSRCGVPVCSRYVARDPDLQATVTTTPQETVALIKMLGPEFQSNCQRILD